MKIQEGDFEVEAPFLIEHTKDYYLKPLKKIKGYLDVHQGRYGTLSREE